VIASKGRLMREAIRSSSRDRVQRSPDEGGNQVFQPAVTACLGSVTCLEPSEIGRCGEQLMREAISMQSVMESSHAWNHRRLGAAASS
jgi:hypothetical protein